MPLAWQHPRDRRGAYIPLQNRRYLTQEAIEEELAEGRSREEIEAAYMPDFSHVPAEQLGIQAYETTSEGTPISPVFPDTPDGRFKLIEYVATHESVFADQRASLEEWVRILFGSEHAAVDLETGRIDFGDRG